MTLDETADALAALGNPTRLSIYHLLVRAGAPGMTVGRIQAELGVPGSTLSHHLKHLLAVDLVEQERDGTSLVCCAKFDRMDELLDFLTAECCTDFGLDRTG